MEIFNYDDSLLGDLDEELTVNDIKVVS